MAVAIGGPVDGVFALLIAVFFWFVAREQGRWWLIPAVWFTFAGVYWIAGG